MMPYKKTLFLCFICSFLLLFQVVSISATSEQSTDEEISILVLHSYYPTYEWSNEISAGITDVLKASDYSDAEVYFEFMEFYVKDTGIRIPVDKFDSIFGRFQQVDDSRSRKYEGTSLGMSISKGLAQILGGDLRFESECGIGSTFYLRIPYVQNEE